MVLVNKSNGHTVNTGMAWLWTLLFGALYFAYKGIWGHAILSIIIACLTMCISWLIYPFFAGKLIEDHYLKLGYERQY